MNEATLNEARQLLAGFLKARRQEIGYSQEGLADLCGFHRNTIENIEAGKFWPNMRQYFIIAHHLKCFPFLVTYEDQSEYGRLMRQHWTPGNPSSSMTGEQAPN